jgi:4-hydroxythreonine-4-phosphate dehydrogenase
MKSQKPDIILTTGDPNGIGPEIALKLFSDNEILSSCRLRIAGSEKILGYYSNKLKLKEIPSENIIEVLFSGDIKEGKIDKNAGKFSGDSIKKAVELCASGECGAIVTMPVSKEALNEGGYNCPGHTEMLAELTSSGMPVMIMYSGELSVAMLTGHMPLAEVSKKINEDLILKKAGIIFSSLNKDFNIDNPSIGVLALNPHAGDGGMLGSHEQDIYIPAIQKLKNKGCNIGGPFPADAYFGNKLYRNFDITLASYHDQGLIPFKMTSYKDGVNFTAGIGIIRTSPAHGTAFDIAGKGFADASSAKEAVKLAIQLAENRKTRQE